MRQSSVRNIREFGLHVLEEVLVHVEQIACIEGHYESALRRREVDLPDPALHRLVLGNGD